MTRRIELELKGKNHLTYTMRNELVWWGGSSWVGTKGKKSFDMYDEDRVSRTRKVHTWEGEEVRLPRGVAHVKDQTKVIAVHCKGSNELPSLPMAPNITLQLYQTLLPFQTSRRRMFECLHSQGWTTTMSRSWWKLKAEAS